MAAEAFGRAPRDGLAHPFSFDEHQTHQWRVSQDVWDGIVRETEAYWTRREASPDARLLGEPIVIDEDLPANSILLEPIVAPLVAQADGPSTT
jgi:hypothetical protein